MINTTTQTKLPIGAACSGQVDQALQYKLTTNITLKDYELVFLSKLISYFHVIMTDLSKIELSSVLICPSRSVKIYQCECSVKTA